MRRASVGGDGVASTSPVRVDAVVPSLSPDCNHHDTCSPLARGPSEPDAPAGGVGDVPQQSPPPGALPGLDRRLSLATGNAIGDPSLWRSNLPPQGGGKADAFCQRRCPSMVVMMMVAMR